MTFLLIGDVVFVPFGLTAYKNFPADKEQAMKDAVEKAKQKLNSSCCAGKDGQKILEKLEKATFVYSSGLKLCGEVTPWGFFTNSVKIGPNAFDFAKCCLLESTVTHETNHLKLLGSGEKKSYEIEKKCFNCGTGSPP